MAKINRYDGNLAAFASQADTNRRTTFGTETTGDDTLDGNLNADFFTGWQIVGPNEFPTLEDFNAAFFTIGQLMAYVHQVGMPEWNGTQEYHIGSKVNRAGVEYICKTDNHVSATPPESDAANWRLPASVDISYDNTTSGLTADQVQAAIDELFSRQIGWNQTWQDVTADRIEDVLYTNTTGRPIVVSATVSSNGAISRVFLDVDGLRVSSNTSDTTGTGAGNTGSISTASAIVPDGSTYEVSFGPGDTLTWVELR